MSNPIDAFSDELRKRMENPFWGSFIISWLLINWKVVYITISLSSKEINDKIEHIEKLYDFGILGFHNASLLLFLYPILTSAIAVGLMPYFARLYLKAQVYHKEKDNAERKDWIQNEKVLLEKEKELIEEKKDVQSLKSEKDIWDEEYKEIDGSGVIPVLAQFIFQHSGFRYDQNIELISTFDFANAVRYGLIYKEEGNRNYELTKKGEYILKIYPSDKLREYLAPEKLF